MKGDFTRVTDRNFVKRYTDVLRQQGRLDLDADWNEQVALRDRLERIVASDVIGPAGAPEEGGGFEVGVSAGGDDLTLTAGRIYVDGILCELEADALYSEQPFLPIPPPLTEGDDVVAGRTDLVYLDVWKRHITAVEDPELLDPALNGLDTTTRVQTVWQVRSLKSVGDVGCGEAEGFPPAASGARLTTAAVATPDAADPCAVVVAGGYRGIENRFYRVEIHDAGELGAATWKWSRDNGAVLFPIDELFAAPASQLRLGGLGRDAVLTLRQDDWVEIADDASELGFEPGFMARVVNVNPATRVVTLDRDVPAGVFSPARRARVRRWDALLGVDDDGLLTADAGPFDLEDGIQVSFGGGGYRNGDHWSFAARTAGGTVEELVDAPPQGIEHHFAPLAMIRWADAGDGAFAATVTESCRKTFPPLTGICADDVCYDNGVCDLPGVTTVQEALDELCRSRDLRFHNKHLHGWGIVCGLQVACGPGGEEGVRDAVTLRPGYAIDCEGNDVLVEESLRVDVLERVRERDAANPDTPILGPGGDGELCLVLGRNAEGPTVEIELMEPRRSFLQRVLEGTLLQDFYDDCIRRIVDFLRSELDTEAEPGGRLVSPAQRRASMLSNVLVQLLNPENGKYVYLSPAEDRLLRDFYNRLRALLQSESFCAMFADARPLPDYPFREDPPSTIWGKGYQTRLRIESRTGRGYTVGAGNRIHVYDLEREEMIDDLEFPGGEGVRVRDVAFSEDGRRVYAIGTLGSDTLFATADLRGEGYRFGAATVVCDVELVTLGTARSSRNVFAIGRGSGLYEINPEAVQERPEPRYPFNASGHLVMEEGGFAFATVRGRVGSVDEYDQVVRLALDRENITVLPLFDATGAPRTGRDDIAVVAGAPRREPTRLYAVVDGADGGSKELLVYDLGPDAVPRAAVATVPLEDTQIQLAAIPGFVVLSFEDSYRLALLDTRTNTLATQPDSDTPFRHPVQISPRSLAVDPERKRTYALNFASNSLSVVANDRLRPGAQLDLRALAAYRQGVVEAFLDLAGGLLQHLKDCFCDHFLVNCPECDEEDRLYLAAVSIRDRQVYKVCNFSRRKYVKSFPTVEYWLSVVPVIPIVREVVTQLCCMVFPDRLRRFDPTPLAPEGAIAIAPNRFSANQIRRGVSFVQEMSASSARRDLASRIDVASVLTRDWMSATITRPLERAPAPRTSQVVGQRVANAQKELERSGVTVAGVERYDAQRGGANLIDFVRTGGRVPTDRPVTLYEENGVVKYFSVGAAPSTLTTTGPSAETVRLSAEVERLSRVTEELMVTRVAEAATRAEVETLRASIEETRRTAEAAVATRDEELRSLRADVDRLRRERPGPG